MVRNPPFSVVATDLDGTLLRSDGTVSRRTVQALQNASAAGATVLFVTGRSPRSMVPVAREVGHAGLAICTNGAILYNLSSERIVTELTIRPEDIRAVMDRIVTVLPGCTFAVERGGVLSHEKHYTVRWHREPGLQILSREEMCEAPATKLLVQSVSLPPDERLAAAKAVIGDIVSMTRSGDEELLEISAAGVTKATGLETVVQELGVGAMNVIAFGDMPNDIPMMAWAGHSVAVSNAHPEVLLLANEVTTSNDDDGVARVLERLFN